MEVGGQSLQSVLSVSQLLCCSETEAGTALVTCVVGSSGHFPAFRVPLLAHPYPFGLLAATQGEGVDALLLQLPSKAAESQFSLLSLVPPADSGLRGLCSSTARSAPAFASRGSPHPCCGQ